jgi:hypothetical protein
VDREPLTVIQGLIVFQVPLVMLSIQEKFGKVKRWLVEWVVKMPQFRIKE